MVDHPVVIAVAVIMGTEPGVFLPCRGDWRAVFAA